MLFLHISVASAKISALVSVSFCLAYCSVNLRRRFDMKRSDNYVEVFVHRKSIVKNLVMGMKLKALKMNCREKC